MEIAIQGSQGSTGKSEGEVLVCSKPFEFGDADPKTGIINIPGHELEGQTVKDKIVIFPCGCGATTEEWSLYVLKKFGTAPKAVVTMSSYPCACIGGIIAGIPMVSGFDENLLRIVQNGDWASIDAEKRIVRVTKNCN
jgi:uncharacterized protein